MPVSLREAHVLGLPEGSRPLLVGSVDVEVT